ncbi:hypothetical protein [Flavobacterium sp. 25HG05S-40]|uniref:hypothetical protein n=1 Tax=Flavobacterium sp. 25HG05S-40 TaxID=3458682 RepID=UPI00404438F6
MKKIITILLLLMLSMSYSQEVTFIELVSFKTIPVKSTEQILKKKKYSYYTTQNKGVQWKANDGSGIIGFNGKGVVLFMSYNVTLYKKIVNQMKAQSYKLDSKLNNGKLQGDAYIKGKNTVYLNTVSNPDNGKPMYSITLI